jgi:hypothetical protein
MQKKNNNNQKELLKVFLTSNKVNVMKFLKKINQKPTKKAIELVAQQLTKRIENRAQELITEINKSNNKNLNISPQGINKRLKQQDLNVTFQDLNLEFQKTAEFEKTNQKNQEMPVNKNLKNQQEIKKATPEDFDFKIDRNSKKMGNLKEYDKKYFPQLYEKFYEKKPESKKQLHGKYSPYFCPTRLESHKKQTNKKNK